MVMNVVADVFVYGRWVDWFLMDYVLSTAGVVFMASGIRRLSPR